MNTIGSHPGAILFRLSIMIVLIAILMLVFFSYLEDTEKELEHASVLQTKRIIDSSLAVAFASYAVKGRLNDLNQLDGGNPFSVLETYDLLPPAYQGELDYDPPRDLDPGWYYLRHRKAVIYKSRFTGTDRYFKILLSYRDENQSGKFESAVDKFTSLQFVRIEGF
jgi:hypothetical protein